MNNLSDIYLPLGKNKEAQSLYEQILPVIKKKKLLKAPITTSRYPTWLPHITTSNYSSAGEKNWREAASIS